MQEAFLLLTLAFAFAILHKSYSNNVFKLLPYMVTAFAVFLLSFFYRNVPRGCFCCWLPFAAFPIWIITFQKFQIGGKKNGIQQRTGEQEMAYLERSRGKNIAGMADKEKQAEAMTVAEMLKPGIPL